MFGPFGGWQLKSGHYHLLPGGGRVYYHLLARLGELFGTQNPRGSKGNHVLRVESQARNLGLIFEIVIGIFVREISNIYC